MSHAKSSMPTGMGLKQRLDGHQFKQKGRQKKYLASEKIVRQRKTTRTRRLIQKVLNDPAIYKAIDKSSYFPPAAEIKGKDRNGHIYKIK